MDTLHPQMAQSAVDRASDEIVYLHDHSKAHVDRVFADDEGKSPLDSVKPGQPLSLFELVALITETLQHPNYDLKSEADRQKVQNLMESYDADLNEWKRFEFWDEHKNYTRNLIATDNKTYTLMLLCWNPLKASPIHAHAGSNCFMRIIDGVCRETRYAWPKCSNSPMEMLEVNDYPAGQVAFICDELGLHKIDNSREDKAVSLHLYCPPYESCKIYLDPKTGQESECHVTFYSEYGTPVHTSH